MISAHEMIGTGLRCGVRTVRRIRAGFVERRIAGSERSVDFVGRHVEKAKKRALGFGQSAPVGAHRFEEREATREIRGDELRGAVDRTIDVTLCGKVEN